MKPGFMFSNRGMAFGLPFFYIFLVSASGPTELMPVDQLEKYIQKKLRRNDTTLKINDKYIGNEGAKALAQSDLLRNVKTLVIYKGGIGDRGVRALAESKNLGSLGKLFLENNNITDEGARILASSSTFANLNVLNLYRNQIGHCKDNFFVFSNSIFFQKFSVFGPG